ncbi:MAG: ornithine carbamoyltransferase [Armatimonadota bacterium]|nr:ornithine carbamoyltransferase [Armatimonadota bacterium]MDR7422553.1 ornithine carbamoyltransferase [Armatimonadota bacterium]MDR7454222.1 ornithine carbamoyltransferase [Armatimonadota bacterium]MDR7457327.1 ornithine carbamoyltransferase [Armatimonadota bacterium]MDR7497302.1 ornithine carbamoyltransferase [Armatimonadota bacterium]
MRLRGRDYLSVDDLTPEEFSGLIGFARELKGRCAAGDRPALLAGKTLAMIFEKPSLRTRVSFEVGMFQMGGMAVYLGPQDIQLGVREAIPDAARNLERMADGIMARTFAHATVTGLAEAAVVPVINGLSDHEHPCQALGDLLTIAERFPRLGEVRLAWVGDGNNVCHSLLLAAAKVGMTVTVATPQGYQPAAAVVARAREIAAATGGSVTLTGDAREAARGADVVYTDVWASMGQEAEREERARIFRPYQVNAGLLEAARPTAVVMHCLPAHRGEEITDDVLDGPRAIVYDQAENRMHAQKALLAMIL